MGSSFSCCFHKKEPSSASGLHTEALRDIQTEVLRPRLSPPRLVVCPPPSPRLLNVCGVEESDFRDSSTLCLWSLDPRWAETEEGTISVEVNMEGDQTFFGPSEIDTSEEVFLTGTSQPPASTTHQSSCGDLEVSRKISFTSATSPVCRLQFSQPAGKMKELTNETENAGEGSPPPCEGIFIYDDQEKKARFYSAIH